MNIKVNTLFLICFLTLSFDIQAIEVKQVNNLQQLGKLAKKSRLPIMLVFSSSHCPYCDLLKGDFLEPILISKDYTHKVIIRELLVDLEYGTIDGKAIGFDGKETTTEHIAAHYNVNLTPTLLFINHQGLEVEKRIVGINTPEMFGGYLDDAIDNALQTVKVTTQQH